MQEAIVSFVSSGRSSTVGDTSTVSRTPGWFLLLVSVLLLAAMVPGRADAAIEPGLADSEPNTFDSPLLTASGSHIERFRVIVPWDIGTRGTDHPYYARRLQFEEWITKFLTFRSTHPSATFNVGFERINVKEPNVPASGGKIATTMLGHAPTGEQYRTAFDAFLNAFGSHMSYMRVDPWNEPNFNPGNASRVLLPGGTSGVGPYLDQEDNSEGGGVGCDGSNPTVNNCGPRMAAYYYRWALERCEAMSISCNLEGGEFAGGVTPDYIQKYKDHLDSVRPQIWGVHNYSDVTSYQTGLNQNQPDELRKFVRELYCLETSNTGKSLGAHHCTSASNWGSGTGARPPIWVTATGAGYTFSCSEHPAADACEATPSLIFIEEDEMYHNQCEAIAWMMRWDNVDTRIDRVYQYTYMDPNYQSGSDDTGVVEQNGTTSRFAYDVLRNAWTNPTSTQCPPSN